MVKIKFNKSQVNFESPAKGMDTCASCTHYLGYIGERCAIVSGVVLPGDWCKKYKKESMQTQKSPSEINQEVNCAAECERKEADARSNHPGQGIKEHELHITSRTNGKTVEVGFGPQGGGLVPANPFASLAQEGFLHAHPEKLGAKGLAEWDASTKARGTKMPEHVKK